MRFRFYGGFTGFKFAFLTLKLIPLPLEGGDFCSSFALVFPPSVVKGRGFLVECLTPDLASDVKVTSSFLMKVTPLLGEVKSVLY
jgi:hypothetical protein